MNVKSNRISKCDYQQEIKLCCPLGKPNNIWYQLTGPCDQTRKTRWMTRQCILCVWFDFDLFVILLSLYQCWLRMHGCIYYSQYLLACCVNCCRDNMSSWTCGCCGQQLLHSYLFLSLVKTYLLIVYNYVCKEIHINLLQFTNSPLFYEAIITYIVFMCIYLYVIYIGYHTC